MGAWKMVGRWDFDAAPSALAECARARDGEVLHEDRFTVVLRRGDLAIKYRAESLYLRLRQLGRDASLVREHRALERLSRLGLATVEPRGAAATWSGPLVREEILVTTFRADLQSYGYARRTGKPIARELALPALSALARDLRRVHEASVFVNTLGDRNVLVGPGGAYAVLDVARAGRRGSAARDLGLLDKGLAVTLSHEDRLRLLHAYVAAGTALDERALAAAVSRARTRFEKRDPLRASVRRAGRWLRNQRFFRSQLR